MTIYCDWQFRQTCITCVKQRVKFKSSSLCQNENKVIENMSSKATYIFKINSSSDWLIHIHMGGHSTKKKKKKELFPEVKWEFTVAPMQIRKKIFHQRANHHTCVCMWWKQRLSVGWRAEELHLKFEKRNRHPAQRMLSYEKTPCLTGGILSCVPCSPSESCLMLQWIQAPRKTLST